LTQALRGIRLRVPRLELRLPDEQELIELAELAKAGIHPPERMPFYVPWSDRAGLPEFLEEFARHHLDRLAAWSPDEWSLNLVAFHEGAVIGTQTVRADRFAETRTVDTGSWLGQAWQNQGLGTEMRAAVLELAFRGLGAEAATSGSFEDNVQSARVSEKLGYREVGEAYHSPRGTPQRERQYRLERADWRSPVPVELAGVEEALAYFGLR
jgi:RimJ/RimL family protein N-acetyltransferase